jgi:hypothetical protein
MIGIPIDLDCLLECPTLIETGCGLKQKGTPIFLGGVLSLLFAPG